MIPRCKIHDLTIEFRAEPGYEKFASEKFRKVKFLRSFLYLLPTLYLPREVDRRVTSKIYL